MSGVKKYDYSTLTTAIRDYTEVSSDVLTTTIVDGIIMAAEFRIYQECPMDSDRLFKKVHWLLMTIQLIILLELYLLEE